MAKQTINLGTGPNTGTGEPIRTAFNKVNENFTEVYDIAQGAYDYANTIISDTQIDPLARSTANAAYDAANSASVLGQLAFDAANNAGSGADTGNVTFTDTTISPTDGVNLILSAANSEVDIQSLDFRVETTDDVRITGNGTVTLRNSSNVNSITIRTDYNNNDYAWEFGETGTLTTPGDVTVSGDVTGTSGASTLYVKAQPAGNTYIQLNENVDSVIVTMANLVIRTDVGNTPYEWMFDTNGDLLVPNYINFAGDTFIGDETDGSIFRIGAPLGYGVIIETDKDISGNNYEFNFGNDGTLTLPGNISYESACTSSQINFVSNSSGDGNGYTTIELIPDTSLTETDQYLIIDPTQPNHIHIRAGGTQDDSSAELYLGGENSYFRVDNGQDPLVQISSNTYLWTFQTDGTVLFPDSSTQTTAFTVTPTLDSLIVSGSSKLAKVVEPFSDIADATGVVTHDCTNNHIFYHTSLDANFTANFTNLNLANGEATSLTLVLNQGGTAYIANAVQIEGNAQTIKWSANTVPTGNTNAVDVQSFSVLRISDNYIVLGQLSTFG